MSAALNHDAFQPRSPSHWGPGALLAIAAHVLLVLALAAGMNWHSSEPEGVAAELWSALPQIAAPRPGTAVEPPPPAMQRRVEPAVRAAPPAPSRTELDAKIATERALAAASAVRDEATKAEAARKLALAKLVDEKEKSKRAAQADADAKSKLKAEAEADSKIAAADAQAAKKKAADDARVADARQAAIREANLKKMMSQAGAGTSNDANSTGTALRTAGPSAGYAGRIKARIKPNIVLTNAVTGDPHATVLVRLAPDGTITGRSLEKSSGDPAYDDAVLRAIDRTGQLPRDTNGTVPPQMLIEFNLRE